MENETEIMEEITLPERVGILGSKSYRNINGKILKTTRMNFCDNCGFMLDLNKPVVICSTCGKKLCSSHCCTFEYERRHYCQECVQQLLPLSIDGFKVLRCVLAEVEPRKAREFGHMTHESYKQALTELVQAEYIERRGVSLLRSSRPLAKALLAFHTYERAYSQDPTVKHIESELTNYLQEKEAKGCRQEKLSRK